MAGLLAGVGVAGLVSQAITQRRHEIGVRLALGATARQAIATMMKPGIALALVGIAVGGGLSLITVRLLGHMVWGVRPTDPLTFMVTAAILLLVAVAACGAPALRILSRAPAPMLRD